MIAVSSREAFDYVLEEERGIADATHATLRPLTLIEKREVDDILGLHAKDTGYPVGTLNYKLCKFGLLDLANFRDAAGREIQFEKGKDGRITDAFLARIPEDARTEYAREIWAASQLTEDDRKNSRSQSTSPAGSARDSTAIAVTTT